MTKIVGVSGAQGAGKTTLLEELKLRGWVVDDFKVSRAVQAELGWTSLSQVTTDAETMTTFQEEVLRQKLQRERSLLSTSGVEVVLTERTFADVAAYATLWTWQLADEGKWKVEEGGTWLQGFVRRCVEAQRECYSAVVLLPYMSHIEWQHDANRASRGDTEYIFETIQQFMRNFDFIRLPKWLLTEETIEDRANAIERLLETI